jgi:hypothetical protein
LPLQLHSSALPFTTRTAEEQFLPAPECSCCFALASLVGAGTRNPRFMTSPASARQINCHQRTIGISVEVIFGAYLIYKALK